MNQDEIRVVELFGGVGGFRVGMENASNKFKVVWSNDNDKFACQIYRKRFGDKGDRQLGARIRGRQCGIALAAREMHGKVTTIETGMKPQNFMKETSEQLTLLPYQITISSVRDFLAKVFQSLGKEGALKMPEVHSSLRYAECFGLREPRIFGLKMLTDFYQQVMLNHTKRWKRKLEKWSGSISGGINTPLNAIRVDGQWYKRPVPYQVQKDGFLPPFFKRWMNWGMMCNGISLTAGHSYHKTESGYSLSDVLEDNPDSKYSLSEKAIRGLTRHKEKHQKAGNGFGMNIINGKKARNLNGTGKRVVTATLSGRYYKDGAEILIQESDSEDRRK